MPKRISVSRYWFARPVLAITSYYKVIKADGGEKFEYNSFAKHMVQSNKQLINSRGCELQMYLASINEMESLEGKQSSVYLLFVLV